MTDHPTAGPDALFRLFTEIGIIDQLATSWFERVMPDGLRISQFTVLNHFVRLGGPHSPAALARAFQVTKGAMTNTLQRLETRGLIRIDPDPRDGRAKLVQITDNGRETHAACIAALGPAFAKLTAGLDVESLVRITTELERLRRFLDENRPEG